MLEMYKKCGRKMEEMTKMKEMTKMEDSIDKYSVRDYY